MFSSYLMILILCGYVIEGSLQDLQEYFYPEHSFSHADVYQTVAPEDAHYYKAFNVAVSSSDIESAVNNLEGLVKSPGLADDVRAYLLAEQSSYLNRLNRYDEAIESLKNIASLYPQDEEVQIICNAAIGSVMIYGRSGTATYKASEHDIQNHYESFLNTTDSLHPYIIIAHLDYAEYLMSYEQRHDDTESNDLAYDHIKQASSLINQALEQRDPRKIKPFSRFRHYYGSLITGQRSRIRHRFRKFNIDQEEVDIKSVNDDVITLYEYLNNGFISFTADQAQQFLNDHPAMDIVPLLIEVIKDDSNWHQAIVRALGILTFADPQQAQEIMLEIIEDVTNNPGKEITFHQRSVLYGAVGWLGYTGDNDVLPLLGEMKEPSYWTELGIHEKRREPASLAYGLSHLALYSIAQMGTPESELLFKNPGFIPAIVGEADVKALHEVIDYRKAGYLNGWPQKGPSKYKVDGCVITPLPTPRELFIKRVIIIVAILGFLTLCLIVFIFIRYKRKSAR